MWLDRLGSMIKKRMMIDMMNEICKHCSECIQNIDGVCREGEECSCMECLILDQIIKSKDFVGFYH